MVVLQKLVEDSVLTFMATAIKAEKQLLREQVNKNSQNSSQSASQDLSKGFKPKAGSKGRKKQGGQPGHEGHSQSLYPIEACESAIGVSSDRMLALW